MKQSSDSGTALLLGIDGGATKTVAILSTVDLKLVKRLESGPANLKLLVSDSHLERNLREIAAQMPKPCAIAVGLAGVWSEQDSKRVINVANKIWPNIPCRASNDLETAMAAADDLCTDRARVLVVSGTGSCCFAKDTAGNAVKVGSGGHVIADTASAFQLSVEALRGVFAHFEETGRWPDLGGRLLDALQFNEPDDLIGWANTAGKTELSRLAPEVIHAWRAGDRIAKRVVEKATLQLARQARICAKRAGYKAGKVCFLLSGSMLLKQIGFQKLLAGQLKRACPGCRVQPLEKESAWGAVELARQLHQQNGDVKPEASPMIPVSTPKPDTLSRTEERNPRSMNLDRVKISEAIELMLSEDARIPEALLACKKDIEAAIETIVCGLRKGGRLFYVGAGTSGRLGILDASECPPTFRTPPDMVQGIMAGGMAALWQSLEGAEDDYAAGVRTMAARNLKATDIVVGIAASGTTPFVWGAFDQARKARASTVLVSFNPRLRIPDNCRPDVVIAADVGPEVLTGSTRLKAGTGTKLILNMFTTIAMVRLGKVRSNLMVDMNPSNTKLKERAVRIVCDLTQADPARAREALEKSHWVLQRALDIAATAIGK